MRVYVLKWPFRLLFKWWKLKWRKTKTKIKKKTHLYIINMACNMYTCMIEIRTHSSSIIYSLIISLCAWRQGETALTIVDCVIFKECSSNSKSHSCEILCLQFLYVHFFFFVSGKCVIKALWPHHPNKRAQCYFRCLFARSSLTFFFFSIAFIFFLYCFFFFVLLFNRTILLRIYVCLLRYSGKISSMYLRRL